MQYFYITFNEQKQSVSVLVVIGRSVDSVLTFGPCYFENVVTKMWQLSKQFYTVRNALYVIVLLMTCD